MPATVPTFRDTTRLTRWVVVLLDVHAVSCAVLFFSDWMQLKLLGSAPYSVADAEANDARQTVVGVIYLLSLIATAVSFAIWVYRANVNTRALGAQDMEFTPGWAVGWYFVPIANLWKPYHAMTEIWQASRNPAAWQSELRTSVLPRWWLFWIISSIAGQIAFRMSFSATTVDTVAAATRLNMIASAATIPCALFLAKLTLEIRSMQMAHAALPESQAPSAAATQPPNP